jgi:hypothetical protein
MKTTITWLNAALATKDIGASMTYYRVADGMISATDGNITASYPWRFGNDGFLVPGVEFEKVLKRMPDNPTISAGEGNIKLKSGRLSGTIQTLPLTDWSHPGVDEAKWKKIPTELLPLLKQLRAFVSDDPSRQASQCIALENGFAYATNNVAIAGAKCDELGEIMALLPPWAVDFLLGREEGLTHWAWTDNYVAFKWFNKAWMRSQLVIGQFPEKAAALVRSAFDEKPTQEITEDFRTAFKEIAELAEDTIMIYADRIESKFGKAEIESESKCETPEGGCSTWGARFLAPALMVADSWSPKMWPAPVPFRGKLLAGYVVGRK